MIDESDIDKKIEEYFEANYRALLAEGGAHILTTRALAQAKQQVHHYWKKMREIAVNVTDTEIRLQLPNQKTKKGRPFVIEGVVDLVREADEIRLYDIKTHYCDEVRSALPSYEAQLNVYAYIWRELRGQELHEMGVIAIQLPPALREAIKNNDQKEISKQLEGWNPLVEIDYDPNAIDRIISEIADIVDKIEDGRFEPVPASTLSSSVGKDFNQGGRNVLFATLHCRNCDGRFSCSSYRTYVTGASKGARAGKSIELLNYIAEVHDDGDLDDWIDGNIELDLDRLASFDEG